MLTILQVTPLRTEKRHAFVDWTDDATGMPMGDLREIDAPIYPEEPRCKQLREHRVRHRIGLSTASRALEITAEQLSGLERGRYTLSDADWAEAMRLLGAFPALPEGTEKP